MLVTPPRKGRRYCDGRQKHLRSRANSTRYGDEKLQARVKELEAENAKLRARVQGLEAVVVGLRELRNGCLEIMDDYGLPSTCDAVIRKRGEAAAYSHAADLLGAALKGDPQ